MRLANVDGRACVVGAEGGVDINTATEGSFSPLVDDAIPVLADIAGAIEGTPDGVGSGRDPRRFIEPGWEITSTIEGLGSISNSFVA